MLKLVFFVLLIGFRRISSLGPEALDTKITPGRNFDGKKLFFFCESDDLEPTNESWFIKTLKASGFIIETPAAQDLNIMPRCSDALRYFRRIPTKADCAIIMQRTFDQGKHFFKVHLFASGRECDPFIVNGKNQKQMSLGIIYKLQQHLK